MKIILGTAQIGLHYGATNSIGKPSTESAIELLDLAFQSSIDRVDSAEGYGNANQIIGKYHINSGNKFNVINKILRDPCGRSRLSQYKSDIVETLDVLSIKQYDTLMVHDYRLILEDPYYSDFLLSLKEEGITRRIGVSIQSPDIVPQILQYVPVDLIQLPFNIFDQSALHSGILYKMKEHGIEVHVRSIFLQGILLNNFSSLPTYFDTYSSAFSKYDQFCSNHNLTKLEATLGFVLGVKEVDSMVIGCQNKIELEQIINAYNNVLQVSTLDFDYTSLVQLDDNLINPTKWSL